MLVAGGDGNLGPGGSPNGAINVGNVAVRRIGEINREIQGWEQSGFRLINPGSCGFTESVDMGVNVGKIADVAKVESEVIREGEGRAVANGGEVVDEGIDVVEEE